MLELLRDEHFWVGVALVVLLGVLVMVGVHKFVWKALGDAGAKVQAQLDEAEALRKEAQDLLAQVKTQKAAADRQAAEMLANAQEEAKRLAADAQAKLAEQIERRGVMAERRIAQAEAQAAADVKAAAADLAAQMAETVLTARLTGAKSDPLIDQAIGQLAGKLQ
jgi:F-type H+-transporting ATPase subunit b